MIVPPAAALPVDDPQFWIATAMVLAAGALALARVVRGLRAERARPCASCPHARAAVAPAAARAPRRLPVLPAALLAALAAAPLAAVSARLERQVQAMGTTLRVEVTAADRAAALASAESIVAAVAEGERRLSTWRDDSELAALGRAPVGAEVELSPATFAELRAALACAEATGGAFDPTVAPLVAAWGLRGSGRRPSEAELAAARAQVGIARLRLDPERGSARKAAPVAIEEGGFGKGAALDVALEALAARTGAERAVVDLGGQIAWAGASPDALDLADPRRRARPALVLDLAGSSFARRGSLAVSGNSERSRIVDGVAIGHLLDPRTGRPADDFGAVAVLDASALRADCLSTALFVLGPERGLVWLAEHGSGAEAVFLVVEGDGLAVRATPGLAGRLRAAPERIVEGEESPEGSS